MALTGQVFIDAAITYSDAAEAVKERYPDSTHVLSHLYGMALELALKAVLLNAGRSESDLRGLGHDLGRLLEEAEGLGLTHTGSRRFRLGVLGANYQDRMFAYPEQGLVNIILPDRLSEITREIIAEVRTTILKMPPQPVSAPTDESSTVVVDYETKDGIDLEGVDSFKDQLASDYAATVQSKPGGLGGAGALFQLTVTFLTALPLQHVAQLLLDGIAFDAIKYGARSFLLKPFLKAYKELKERNPSPRGVEIWEFALKFRDATLLIKNVSDDGPWSELEKVLRTVAEHFRYLALSTGEAPAAITIPVLEDRLSGLCRFRVVGNIEEPITARASDYYRYWGLNYASGSRRVYDVERHLLIDERWLSLMEYYSKL